MKPENRKKRKGEKTQEEGSIRAGNREWPNDAPTALPATETQHAHCCGEPLSAPSSPHYGRHQATSDAGGIIMTAGGILACFGIG